MALRTEKHKGTGVHCPGTSALSEGKVCRDGILDRPESSCHVASLYFFKNLFWKSESLTVTMNAGVPLKT